MTSYLPRHAQPARRARPQLITALVVVGVAAGATGALAHYRDTQQATAAAAAGRLRLSLDPADVRLDTATLAPGEQREHLLTLLNDASIDSSAVQLTLTGTGTELTQASDGVQIRIDRCEVPWQPSATPGRYSCPGSTRAVLAERPAAGRHTVTGLAAAHPGGSDALRVTISLSPSSPSAAQDQRGTVTLAVRAVQRDGLHR